MPRDEASGLAAVALCESLLLSLAENDVLSLEEVRNVLGDAEDALRQAASEANNGDDEVSAADILKRVSQGRNALKWPKEDES